MINRPNPTTRTIDAPSLRRALVAILAMIGLVGGCGGDQQRGFLFQVRDDRDQPVADVRAYYLSGDDTVSVGRTDSNGNLIVDRKHLETMPREFGFLLPSIYGETSAAFDPDRCEMIHSATRKNYRVDGNAGTVGPSDLEIVPDGWRHPGRVVILELEPSDPASEPEVLYTIPMTISTLIRTEPGARVSIDDIFLGETNPDGELAVSFCWGREENGNYVPRSEVEIEIAKPGFQSRRGSITIPDDGKLNEVVWNLDRSPDRTRPIEPTEPTVTLVNLRVKHLASAVRSCGPDGNELPSLRVNDEATTIAHLPSDALGMRVWFDLIVQAGQEYCLAVACGGGPDETTWYPWDASANERRWHRFRVPADARRLLLVIPDGVDPSQALQPERVEDLPGFDEAACRTIRQSCRR